MDDSGQHAIEGASLCWHTDPVPTQIAIDTYSCVYIACFATALVYTNRSPVVSQDVAIVLEMHACVGRDQHLSFILLAIPTEAPACMCSGYASVGGAPRHTVPVVIVFVCLSVCVCVCVCYSSARFSRQPQQIKQ